MKITKYRGSRDSSLSRWKDLGAVESDTELGVWHAIQQHERTGTVRCACKSYQFSPSPKTCKHLQAFLSDQPRVTQTVQVRQKGRMPAERQETFTVRRAISFGDVPIGGA